MSLNSYNAALDFMPTGAPHRSLWSKIRIVAFSLVEGHRARAAYRQHIARGGDPSEGAHWAMTRGL